MDRGTDGQQVALKDDLSDIGELPLEIEKNQDVATSSSDILRQECLSTDTTASEVGAQYSNQDDTPFIEEFFNRWSSLANQGFQLDSPTQIYNDIENDPNLTPYHSVFVNARLKLDWLSPQASSSLLQTFIIRRCINEFRNFECVAAGAIYCMQGHNRIEASNLMASMESRAGAFSNYAEKMQSTVNSYQGLNEALGKLANNITTVSSKLDEYFKTFEFETENSSPIKGYKCEPYFLIANENGAVDEKETKKLYPQMTPLDERLLNILSSFTATTVCYYTFLNWEQLVELIPSDSTLSKDNLLIAFAKNFNVRYPNPVQGKLQAYSPTNIPA